MYWAYTGLHLVLPWISEIILSRTQPGPTGRTGKPEMPEIHGGGSPEQDQDARKDGIDGMDEQGGLSFHTAQGHGTSSKIEKTKRQIPRPLSYRMWVSIL